jgi:2-iminobutanoate/2-iminopropanoate deaminase
MMRRFSSLCVTAFVLAASLASAHAESPSGVKTLDPPGAIKAEGTWSLGAHAGDFIFCRASTQRPMRW